MSVEIQHITKLFGKQKALNDISFNIGTGEVVGLLGPNGAGKSTLMKIITGYLSPTSGNVIINGINTQKDPVGIRQNIGYLPENNPLYSEMFIREFLEFIGRIYKMKGLLNIRIDEIIRLTGLTPEQNKKINTLSKGYRQRVGLAQALIHNPDVLILDEPTSGLDPNQIRDIRDLISTSGQEKTVILSTHIMQEVEAICDRIIIIDKGQLVADEQAVNIQSQSSTENQTVLLEFDRSPEKEVLKQITGVGTVLQIKENKWLLQSQSKEDIRPYIFQFAVDQKLTVLSLAEQEKSLEDIFQELTQTK
ncbi:MAG: gliding motility-associated ABC transporter ATP-binding subunit GldA [Bacteroidota bacterium]|nr:gliding motility-associated ABC transporter ATP-binding subunit GldA [Bacteroidota bacterium]